MKGIILAGGSGSRLFPTTLAVSKQLLPVGDKPMIYYPLSVLMMAGLRDILIITRPLDLPQFRHLLGDGSRLGLNLDYAVQPEPNGLPEAFLIGARHIGHDDVALVLGDNIFHGPSLHHIMRDHSVRGIDGCVLFGQRVNDPQRYAVGEVGADGQLISLCEKPSRPRSNLAITGLYLYGNDVIDVAGRQRPSARGELEITDVNRHYLAQGRVRWHDLGRGFAWLDAGTPESLLKASLYIETLQEHQGVRIACLEEVALRMGYIDAQACHRLGAALADSAYGRYVMAVAEEVSAARDERPPSPVPHSTQSAGRDERIAQNGNQKEAHDTDPVDNQDRQPVF